MATETLDLAALEEGERRLLETVQSTDRWFLYTVACSRLSTWLTEHAADLLRLARLGLERDRFGVNADQLRAQLNANCLERDQLTLRLQELETETKRLAGALEIQWQAMRQIGRLADRDDPNVSDVMTRLGIREWVRAALARAEVPDAS
jgi:hypothetical protein